MSEFLSELLGTMMLILFGNGVVCNVVLKKTKGSGNDWLLISVGWALAVTIPVYIFGPIGGGHFNPAFTLAVASIGDFEWTKVPMYITAQLIGAMVGAILVYIMYMPHFKATEDEGSKLACFATSPAIDNRVGNFVSEFIGTFVLVFALLGVQNTETVSGLGPIIVGLVILGIGVSLGGTTGYAINPARDLGPRIVHSILFSREKISSEWRYAWVPIIAPICGAVIAATIYTAIF